MIKKDFIVASRNQNLFTTKRLLEEATRLGLKSQWINPYQFALPLLKKTSKEGVYFHRSTGTNYDDFDLIVSDAHAQAGYKVSNPVHAIKDLRAKDLQWLFMQKHSLPTIDTLLYRGTLSESSLGLLNKWTKKDDRLILKMVRGNQGIGVNLLQGLPSLLSVLETFQAMNDQRFIIQPYIEHKKEWRMLMQKDRALVVMEKKLSADDFRGNAKRSTPKVLKKCPVHLEELAVKASLLSGLDYTGIDILEDSHGVYRILEINPVAGFEHAEELSGKNIARELITLFL